MDQHSRDAAATLAQLQSDRARLDTTTRTPWWLPTGLGVVVAVWVASPALSPSSLNYGTAVIAVLVLLEAGRRHSGLRASARGPQAWALGALWLLITLIAYSTALGLVASGLPVWVLAPAAAAGTVTCLFARTVDQWAREALRP